MKKILLLLFPCVFIFLSALELCADQFGSTTTVSLPAHVARFLDSPGSIDDARDKTCQSYYDPSLEWSRQRWVKRLKLYGWVEGGFYLNSYGNKSRHLRVPDRDDSSERFQIPGSGNSTQLGKVRSTEPMINQLWVGLKRDLETRQGFDWGFKTDFMLGTDGWMTQSYSDASFDYRGHSRDYYASLPQIYGTLGYHNWAVKIGKFETLLGVEEPEAVSTMFYSRSNLFYTEAQTHCGALAEYRCNENLLFEFGYVQGADNSFRNRFDDHGFLGGVSWRPIPTVALWYTVYAADIGNGVYENAEIHPGGAVYQHTFAVHWSFSPRWLYTFQWDLGNRNGSDGAADARHFGTAHYLTYQCNQYWKFGVRFDQIHANQWMNNSGFSRPFTGDYTGDLYSVTLGVNWTPYKRISIRPEFRYDYAEDSRPFDNYRKRGQFSAGCGLVYLF